ncbi:hypothetical protein P7C70_g7756, partial [Phenoliferia sp. Uapishka_3]
MLPILVILLSCGFALGAPTTSARKLPLPVLPANQTQLTIVPNYTCNSGTWASVGAVAKLYDISSLPPSCYANLPALSLAIPVSALPTTPASGRHRLARAAPAAPKSPASIFKNAFLGNHFFVTFNGALSPEFDFQVTQGPGEFVIAKRNGSIPAPTNPTKNVAWLELSEVSGELAKTVYRTSTAGGQPPTSCGTSGALLSVDYAALYWFLT